MITTSCVLGSHLSTIIKSSEDITATEDVSHVAPVSAVSSFNDSQCVLTTTQTLASSHASVTDQMVSLHSLVSEFQSTSHLAEDVEYTGDVSTVASVLK